MVRRLDRKALILDGRPACGKGTQANKLKEYAQRGGLCVATIATGDVIRAVNRGDTPEHPWDDFLRSIAPRVQAELPKMKAGELLSDGVAIEVAEYLFSQIPDSLDPDLFILDGFPRTDVQVEATSRLLAAHGVRMTSDNSAAYALRVRLDREACVERQLQRASKEGRPDDVDSTVIARRQDIYELNQNLVRELLTRLGFHFMQVNAHGLAVESLTSRLIATLPDNFFTKTLGREVDHVLSSGSRT